MTAAETIRAGAAAAPIPPSADDLRRGVYLGGYGSYRARRATGVHDDPWCRALALDGGHGPFVICPLDMIGVAGSVLADVRRAVSRATGLPPERLLVASTHSHSSPDLQELWGGVPPAYARRLVEVCADTVGRALASLAPARLAVGGGRVSGLTVNRRDWPEVDEEMVVLRAAGVDGAPIATLVNFACHATSIGPQSVLVSRDFPGYLVDRLSAELGGLALFVNGAQGDANPAVSAPNFSEAERLGEALAAAASRASQEAEAVEGEVHLLPTALRIPLRQERLPSWAPRVMAALSPGLRPLARSGALRRLADLASARRRPQAAQIIAGLSLAAGHGLARDAGLPLVPTYAAYLRFGEQAEGYAVPGEVMTRLAHSLKQRLKAPRRLFLGLTYDSLGYFLPEDEWMSGRNHGYEESVSMGRSAGPTLAAALAAVTPAP